MDIENTVTSNMQTNLLNQSGIGSRLKSARENLNLSEKDAALRLHLSPKFIEIMENEDFQNGPPAAFMRGYLRSYARLLKITEKEIDEAIEGLGMNAPVAAKISPLMQISATGPRQSERFVSWISYLIVLVLLGLVGFWWKSHTKEMSLEAGKIQQEATEANPFTATPQQQPIAPAATTNPNPPPPANFENNHDIFAAPSSAPSPDQVAAPSQTPAMSTPMPNQVNSPAAYGNENAAGSLHSGNENAGVPHSGNGNTGSSHNPFAEQPSIEQPAPVAPRTNAEMQTNTQTNRQDSDEEGISSPTPSGPEDTSIPEPGLE